MGEKYLADVIDFDKDIKPYRLIQIYSGVGSGKNTWVTTLADDGYSILLITSRKATADAQAKKMEATRFIDIDEVYTKEDSNEQNLCICTNAGIEKFVKTVYDIDKPKTYIWNYFDFIILDEAHSLVTDATFTDAPFHVMKFLRHIEDTENRCKLVFMTGTPEPIEWIFSNSTKMSGEYKYLDYYKDCVHVEPEQLILFPYKNAAGEIVAQLKDHKDERIIYFANRIEHIKKLVGELQERGVTEDEIGISYSDRTRDVSFSKRLTEKMDRIRESLVNEESIPQDIRIFITTTQNKEGINIIDSDIKLMFSECTQRTELIQIAGRVRKGLEALMVLYDTPQYFTFMTDFEALRDRKCLEKVNEAFDQFLEVPIMSEEGNPQKVISNIEKSFSNIRFDYFTYQFELYAGRIRGSNQAQKDAHYVKECFSCWCQEYTDIHRLDKGEGAINFQKWFPYSDCRELYTPLPLSKQKKKLNKEVSDLLQKSESLDVVITKEQRDELTAQLNKLLLGYDSKGLKITYPICNLGPALKKLGYSLKPFGKNSGEKWIIKTTGEK